MHNIMSRLAYCSALAILTVAALTALLSGVGRGHPNWIYLSFVLLLIAALAFAAHTLPRDDALRRDIFGRTREFVFEVFRTPYVWPVAIWIGALFASGHMLVSWLLYVLERPQDFWGMAGWPPYGDLSETDPYRFPWRQQVPAAFGSFIAGMTTVVVVGAFYRRFAPYTRLYELMEEIIHDIRKQRQHNPGMLDVWWAFPGFGLGRFRSLDEEGKESDGADLYDRFHETIVGLLASHHVRVRGIVYNESCLKLFYAAYEEQQPDGNQTAQKRMSESAQLENTTAIANGLRATWGGKRVTRCVLEEKALKDAAVLHNNTDIFVAKSPEAIPNFVFVIGSVVYQIATYGAPIYMRLPNCALLGEPFEEIGGLFAPSPSRGGGDPLRDDLLRLVAFRRQDEAFARLVMDDLNRHALAATSAGVIMNSTGG